MCPADCEGSNYGQRKQYRLLLNSVWIVCEGMQAHSLNKFRITMLMMNGSAWHETNAHLQIFFPPFYQYRITREEAPLLIQRKFSKFYGGSKALSTYHYQYKSYNSICFQSQTTQLHVDKNILCLQRALGAELDICDSAHILPKKIIHDCLVSSFPHTTIGLSMLSLIECNPDVYMSFLLWRCESWRVLQHMLQRVKKYYVVNILQYPNDQTLFLTLTLNL